MTAWPLYTTCKGQQGTYAVPVLLDDSHALKGALQLIRIAAELHQLGV